MTGERHMLFDAANNAFRNAYAPYSNFAVGAAIETASGAVFSGCNVENVAYPQGTCAEAGAIAAMVAAGERQIKQVLVLADSPVAVSPCGGCRQKLAEFSSPDTMIILAGPEGERQRMTMAELLPYAFDQVQLDNKS